MCVCAAPFPWPPPAFVLCFLFVCVWDERWSASVPDKRLLPTPFTFLTAFASRFRSEVCFSCWNEWMELREVRGRRTGLRQRKKSQAHRKHTPNERSLWPPNHSLPWDGRETLRSMLELKCCIWVCVFGITGWESELCLSWLVWIKS